MNCWSRFDAIYCINFSKYTTRKNLQKIELARVGILEHDNFMWKETISCPQYHILFDTLKQNSFTNCKTVTEFNIAMAHFECIKSAYESGCSNVLIIEDDIRFLKDISKLFNIVDSTPDDFDIVLYDTTPRVKSDYDRYCSDRVNGHFARYENLYSNGCYALSRRAMEKIISLDESYLSISDMNTSDFTNDCGFNKYFAFESPTCQIVFGDCNTTSQLDLDTINNAYITKGLNYSDYEIPNDYSYGTLLSNGLKEHEDVLRYTPTKTDEELKRFFDENRVLFATNGDYGKDSPLEYSLRTYRCLTDEVFVVPCGAEKCFGRDAFYKIFLYAIEHEYRYVIYVDADCFISNRINLKIEFESFKNDPVNNIFSGVTDGGVICHRNKNPFSINPFLMFVNVELLKQFYSNGKLNFGSKEEYVKFVTETTKRSRMNTCQEYVDFQVTNRNYTVPHALLISQPHTDDDLVRNEYGVNQKVYTSNENDTSFEPYYDIFLPIGKKSMSIRFMYGRDYPSKEDFTGITSAIFLSENGKTERYSEDNMICQHTWFTRLCKNGSGSSFEQGHYNRMIAVAKKCIRMSDDSVK